MTKQSFQRVPVIAALLATLWLVAVPVGSQAQEAPSLPLEEIVEKFTQKESDYAGAHSLYQYTLTIRVQELDEEGDVVGEFEQEGTVEFGRRGQRTMRLTTNPRTDLVHLNISRIALEELSRIPLFLLRPEDKEKYDITYLTSERVDEVITYLFRIRPKGVPRVIENLFEGVVWVDSEQYDIVRVQGRLRPAHDNGPLGRYFQRMEIYRQPVDDFLFPTYVRSDDIVRAVGGEGTVRARLIVRFKDHKRIDAPEQEDSNPSQE
jgi:hypothetical protein